MGHRLLGSVLVGMLFSVSSLADFTEKGDSGITGPSYDEIWGQMETLESLYPQLVRSVTYGTSVKGKPLRLLYMSKYRNQRQHPAVVITGSTHGNEYLNIEDRLPEAFLKLATEQSAVETFLNIGGVIVLVPILNPDGYDARERENANGVDLNRDWDVPPVGFKGFSEVESRSLARQLETWHEGSTLLDYRVTVDYHCCIGALLYPWSYTDHSIPTADLQAHGVINKLAKEKLNVSAGTTSNILGYHALGTTKDYYFSRYGARAFTYEGHYKKESKYLDQHVSWWESIFTVLVSEMAEPFLNIAPRKHQQALPQLGHL